MKIYFDCLLSFLTSMVFWYLYIPVAISIGSRIFRELWFMIKEFSWMSNVEKAFFKKYLVIWLFLDHLTLLNLFPLVLYYFHNFLYLIKKLNCFPKQLIVFNKRGIYFVKEFFMFLNVKPIAIIFLFFISSERLIIFFVFFFEIKIFQMAFSLWLFT